MAYFLIWIDFTDYFLIWIDFTDYFLIWKVARMARLDAHRKAAEVIGVVVACMDRNAC